MFGGRIIKGAIGRGGSMITFQYSSCQSLNHNNNAERYSSSSRSGKHMTGSMTRGERTQRSKLPYQADYSKRHGHIQVPMRRHRQFFSFPSLFNGINNHEMI